MARAKSPAEKVQEKASASTSAWAKLTWGDLENWAGNGAVTRGQAYQRSGRVKKLKISAEGDLLATVQGTERYATTVSLGSGGKNSSLNSDCTCPVGYTCKHAIATVAEYLEAVAEGRDVPIASENDPRWARLEASGYDDDEWDDEEEEEEERPVKTVPASRKRSGKAGPPVNWDAKIEQHIREKSHGELADLAWSLVRRSPEIYKEYREKLALQAGDVSQLIAEARSQIKKVTTEPGWQNHWDREGYTPDYGPIQHRLERLLAMGHADEVVSLGRDLIRKGLEQVGQSNDEGETTMAFAECLPVVFQAVMKSSLTGPERLLFAIDAEMEDGYDAIGEASGIVFEGATDPQDWSLVADTLAARLKASPVGKGDDSFSRNYKRDGLSGWVAKALEKAGRGGELLALYESEARITGSYERIVRYLLGDNRFEDAERWAKEGIAATRDKYPGTADSLARSLGELAALRKQWDVVAALAARAFFDHPSVRTFDELLTAAKKAKVEEAVRSAALRFLETGVQPYQMNATAPARTKSSSKNPPAAAVSVKIDPSWPLPVPDFLIMLMKPRPGFYVPAPQPHLEVLLEMAIAAKQPERVLHWYDKMHAGKPNGGVYQADRVAEAVAATHPERTLEIYLAALNAQLPHAQVSSYESATGYLKKLRPIYQSLGRANEWDALLATIREKYRIRPRFMELLDRLDNQPIVQWKRTKRR